MAKGKKPLPRKSGGAKIQILALVFLGAAFLFMPTTIFLLFGMLPTVVAAVIDRGRGTRALTVGAMNLAGCTPFLLDLWTKSNTSDYALMLITDPRTVIVVYAASAIGYLIDWALSGIVATVMIQGAGSRLKAIRKAQAALVERWGPEVTGEITLDPQGFPLEAAPLPEEPPKAPAA